MRDVEHAIEVHRHDVLPILDHCIRIGGKCVAPIDAGIVDEDRDLADKAGDLRGDGAAGHSIGDVELEVLCLATGITNIRCRRGGPLTIDVQHRDLRALAGIAERDGAADPRSPAGDYRDVVLQKPRHLCRSSFWIGQGVSGSSSNAK